MTQEQNMTIDDAIALCHHDGGEPRETWKLAAFVATAEVMRMRQEKQFFLTALALFLRREKDASAVFSALERDAVGPPDKVQIAQGEDPRTMTMWLRLIPISWAPGARP